MGFSAGFCGGWLNPSVHGGTTPFTRVGNGLAEVFAKGTGNGDEGTTQRGLAVEHFLWLVRIFLFERNDGIAEMRKGVFQGLQGVPRARATP